MLMVAAGNAYYDNGDIQQAANYYVDATSDKNNSNSRYHLIQLLVDDQQQKLSVQYIHQLILLETQGTTGDAAAVPSENLLTVGSSVFWDAGRIQESNIFSERLLSTTATASKIGQMLVNRIVQGYVQMGRYNQALDMYQLGCKGQTCEDEALEQELRANEMDYHDARKQLSVHNPQEDNLDTARLAYALAPENTKAEMALALVKRLYTNDNNAVKEEITDILKEEYEISTTKSTTMALRVHMTWAEHLFSGGTAFAVEKATEIIN
jgi:tetratricopeptide (TPR) repeat protein